MNESEGAVYVDEGAQDLSFVEEALNCEVENNASSWRWGGVRLRRKEFAVCRDGDGRGGEGKRGGFSSLREGDFLGILCYASRMTYGGDLYGLVG